MIRKVTVIRIRRGLEGNVNNDLQWLGNSLGLFGLRDKDSSCFRIFITLVKKADNHLSSDKIAERLSLSRGTVVHHLTRLIDSGIAIREKEGYILREQSLLRLIEDLKRDTESVFAELQEVAKEIDERIH